MDVETLEFLKIQRKGQALIKFNFRSIFRYGAFYNLRGYRIDSFFVLS